jgi:hypothetical protein
MTIDRAPDELTKVDRALGRLTSVDRASADGE